jgi:hypothetical protein
MTMRALAVLLFASLIVTGIAPDASQAATVDVVGGSHGVRYVAGPGEHNEVRFAEIEDSWPTAFLVSDPGATVTVGRGCVSVDAHSAACVARSGSMYHLRARLGDGGDVLHPAGFNIVRAEGGPGNDRLLGGTWDDRLDGGGGTDELRGGDGNDVLLDGDRDGGAPGEAPDADILDGGDGGDWVSYQQRTEPVTVDLSDPGPDGAAGESDLLLNVESVRGGRGDDRLTGDDSPNSFADEGGENQLFGKAGGDSFQAARSGPVDCGSGPDTVRGVTRKTLLARNCETVLHAWADSDFLVRAYPRETAGGMTLAMECADDYDGLPNVCSGHVTIRALSRTLARGTIPAGTNRRRARLTLTPAGRRLLARRAVAAIIELRGPGLPDMEWTITLGPRQ